MSLAALQTKIKTRHDRVELVDVIDTISHWFINSNVAERQLMKQYIDSIRTRIDQKDTITAKPPEQAKPETGTKGEQV